MRKWRLAAVTTLLVVMAVSCSDSSEIARSSSENIDSSVASSTSSTRPEALSDLEDYSSADASSVPAEAAEAAAKSVAADSVAADSLSLPGGPPLGPPLELEQNLTFQSSGVGSFVSAADDPLSTFSLDADTASYDIAVYNIEHVGTLPNPDSVRVEDFLNSYPQGYPAVEPGLGVVLDGMAAPFHENALLLRVGVVPATDDTPRDPVTVIFIVDTSGSMSGTPLDTTKEIIKGVIAQLRPGDRAALVEYESSARVITPPTDDINAVADAAADLYTKGSTYAEQGIRVGYQLAEAELERGHNVRMVLLSDGVGNVGQTDPEVILDTVGDWAQKGATLTTVGVGDSSWYYNDVMLEVLANRGNGVYYYVRSVEAGRRFSDIAGNVLRESARDARIQVEFNPQAVDQWRLIGYENRAVADEDFLDDSLDFGEVGFARPVTAIYEIITTDNSAGDMRLAEATVRWRDPRSQDVKSLSNQVDVGTIESGRESAHLTHTAAVAELAEILRCSPYTEDTRINRVIDYINTTDATTVAYNSGFAELLSAASGLETHCSSDPAPQPESGK
ncbi:MAG: von Willebrand factor type A domain-containing protein [Acidimicrobiaceae bacterium]|nr:von Willebrand factor type A domain-containing protein [Acidimicrobiaceae bacterium]